MNGNANASVSVYVNLPSDDGVKEVDGMVSPVSLLSTIVVPQSTSHSHSLASSSSSSFVVYIVSSHRRPC